LNVSPYALLEEETALSGKGQAAGTPLSEVAGETETGDSRAWRMLEAMIVRVSKAAGDKLEKWGRGAAAATSSSSEAPREAADVLQEVLTAPDLEDAAAHGELPQRSQEQYELALFKLETLRGHVVEGSPAVEEPALEPGNLVDMPEAEFSRVVSNATSAGTLLDLYHKIDAERTHRELQWREDEGNPKARAAFTRAVQRRMLVYLSLPGEFVNWSDLERQVKQLGESAKIGPLDQ